MTMRDHADVLVVGAGAVGASTALAAAEAGARVLVVEKEAAPAQHQSGRNSGVAHAGYNLEPGSEKARYCVEGNRRLRTYCAQRGVALREDGILVVARDERERATLDVLESRARGNGVRVARLDEKGIREIEPHARGTDALHALDGASFDAPAFVRALVADAQRAGATFLFGRRVLAIGDDGEVRTDGGTLRARVVVNAAGLFADRLAARLCDDMRVVPFRGSYAELRPERAHLVRAHVYAAPDLAFPFLGVHLSRRADGRVVVGPGAMVALGREAYRLARVQPRDAWDTLTYGGFWRLMARREMRALVRREGLKSVSLAAVAREARLLVPDLRAGDLVRAFAGNRAQMVTREGALVDDVVVRETERAVHVLNAVSPGLTCALPFGEHLAARARTKL